MQTSPREIVTPYRPIPLTVPEGMTPNEFFNSAENLADLTHNNGLLRNPEGLLLREVYGLPVTTILRGEVVVEEGRLATEGTKGQLIDRRLN